MTAPTLPLTRDQIIEIVGRIDDLKIAEILGTGATPAQLTEAKVMLAAGESVAALLGRPVEPIVNRLYEILKADEPEWEE